MICISSLEACSLNQSILIAEYVSAKTNLPIGFWPVNFSAYPCLLQHKSLFEHSCLPTERKGPWCTGITNPLFPGSQANTGIAIASRHGRINKKFVIKVL